MSDDQAAAEGTNHAAMTDDQKSQRQARRAQYDNAFQLVKEASTSDDFAKAKEALSNLRETFYSVPARYMMEYDSSYPMYPYRDVDYNSADPETQAKYRSAYYQEIYDYFYKEMDISYLFVSEDEFRSQYMASFAELLRTKFSWMDWDNIYPPNFFDGEFYSDPGYFSSIYSTFLVFASYIVTGANMFSGPFNLLDSAFYAKEKKADPSVEDPYWQTPESPTKGEQVGYIADYAFNTNFSGNLGAEIDLYRDIYQYYLEQTKTA